MDKKEYALKKGISLEIIEHDSPVAPEGSLPGAPKFRTHVTVKKDGREIDVHYVPGRLSDEDKENLKKEVEEHYGKEAK